MPVKDFVEIAQAYRLLSGLDPRQLRKLLPLADERPFTAGEVIFQEGARSSYLYLIVSGKVALETASSKPPVRVQTLAPGDAMGWSALTEEAFTHFQARALTAVSAIAFPADQIREACDRDPEMGYALTKRLLQLVTERLDAARMQLFPIRAPEAASQG